MSLDLLELQTEAVFDAALPAVAAAADAKGMTVTFNTTTNGFDIKDRSTVVTHCKLFEAINAAPAAVAKMLAEIASYETALVLGPRLRANDSDTLTYTVERAITILGILIWAKTAVTTAGTCVMTIKGATNTLLNAANYDVETLVADTPTEHALTGTAANLDLAVGDEIEVVLTSDNADATGLASLNVLFLYELQ